MLILVMRPQRMGTPVMRTMSYITWGILSFLIMYLFMVFVSQFYMFYESYTNYLNKLTEEHWLREQCQDPLVFSHCIPPFVSERVESDYIHPHPFRCVVLQQHAGPHGPL